MDATSSSFNTAAQILTVGRNLTSMEIATRRAMALYTLVFMPCDFLPKMRTNHHGLKNIKTGKILIPRKNLPDR